MQYKLLLVDDDTGLLKMLRSYFEIRKYTVITAFDGRQALENLLPLPSWMTGKGFMVFRRSRELFCCEMYIKIYT